MSLIPYILSELHDLSMDMDDGPARPPFSVDDVTDLISDLLQYRPPSRPSLLHLMLDGHPAAHGGRHRPVAQFPRQLRRQLSSPLRQHFKAKKGVGAHGPGRRLQLKDKSAFAVDVDVQHFQPEELSVQVLKDEGVVVVEGSHEERPDEHGYVRRQFTRRYKLPEGVDPDTVTSRLSSDGVLQLAAPVRKEALPAPRDNARHVPITHTNQPAALDQLVADEDEAKKSKEATEEEKAVEQ